MNKSDRAQRAIERRLRRTFGMSEEKREAIAKQNKTFSDWTGTCRKCGTPLEGSIETLKGHVCATS